MSRMWLLDKHDSYCSFSALCVELAGVPPQRCTSCTCTSVCRKLTSEMMKEALLNLVPKPFSVFLCFHSLNEPRDEEPALF